tara:strand:+ start:1443 stop:1820 length:378 start_codon:yes stop_codon:yes gene_type:complete
MTICHEPQPTPTEKILLERWEDLAERVEVLMDLYYGGHGDALVSIAQKLYPDNAEDQDQAHVKGAIAGRLFRRREEFADVCAMLEPYFEAWRQWDAYQAQRRRELAKARVDQAVSQVFRDISRGL